MWIADKWKDYEVIDCSKGEKLERWGDYILVSSRSSGHLGYSQKGSWLETQKRTLPPQQERRRRMGIFRSARAVADSLRGPDFQPEAVQLQAHGTFPGAGHQLGLVFREDPPCRAAGKSAQPFRLHRGSHTCRCRCRGAGHPCGCLERNGRMGEGERRLLRVLKDAPIRWLVDDCVKFVEREIRRGNTLRCHYHGPALLRKRAQRRDMEDRGYDPSSDKALHADSVQRRRCSSWSTPTPPALRPRC